MSSVCQRICLIAIILAAPPVSAQSALDKGHLLLRNGGDTLVVDHFARVADTLKGTVRVTGQPRIDYFAILGPGESVRTLTVAVYAAGAPANALPVQRIRIVALGDTLLAETPAGIHRIPTRVGAIPMFNNALALSELFTRRARLTGGLATIPYFAIADGATIDAIIRPVGNDTLTLAIARQTNRLRVDATGRILGGTIAGTNFEFARSTHAGAEPAVAIVDSAIAPARDYAAPAGAPYAAEEVRVTGPGGIVLGGTLTRPTNVRAPWPAVVTITGSGQQDRDEYIPYAGGIRLFRQVADTLGRRGIAVLRLDDRGIGASGGDPGTSTSMEFADDVRAAIAYLRGRPDIDGARIAVVGHSEGGAIAPMIAATDPRLKAMVVMAGPGERAIEISMAQNKYIVDRDSSLTQAKRDSILRFARASLDPARQTNPWVKTWLEYDPAPVARRVTAPTLILQGATDRQVPADQAEKLASLIRAGGNRDVTVHVIPATNHLFVHDESGDFNAYDRLRTNTVGASVLGPLADWLAIRLSARGVGSP